MKSTWDLSRYWQKKKIAGQTVNVAGELDYGFVAGQNIKVLGKIYKNIYIAGNAISFTEDSSVGRDAKIVGSDIKLSGRFERNVDAAGNRVIINDKTIIDGDTTIYADEIRIAGNVTIEGTLKYNENAKIVINDSAAIKNIEKTKAVEENNKVNKKALILGIVNLIVVILVLALVLPKAIDKTKRIYDNKGFDTYAKNFFIGLLIMICIPIISLILMASNIGTHLGLITIALYIIGLYIAYGLGAYVIGELIFNRAFKLNINKYLIIIMGIVLIKLLAFIPILGALIVLIVSALGVTTLWNLMKEEETNEKKVKESSSKDAKVIKETKKVTGTAKSSAKKSSTTKKSSTSKASTTKKTPAKKSTASKTSTAKKSTPKKKTSK